MIEVMNHLDGDAVAFDKRMFVVFGNHEFDDSKCNELLAPLNARVDESQFTYLAANLDFTKCSSMQGMLSRPNVKEDGVVLTINDVKVGLFGIGLTTTDEPNSVESLKKYPPFEDVRKATDRSIKDLRNKGAEFIVGITHLPEETDAELLKAFLSRGLDLLIGGHDHSAMMLPRNDPQPRGFKADSDAKTAWRIEVRFKGGKAHIDARLLGLDEGLDPDPDVGNLAKSWSERADAVLCAERAKEKRQPYDSKCLSEVIGWTQSTIELEEAANRSQQTGIGYWLAKLMLGKTNADVAIINSGILGLNEDLAPGTNLTLKHVVDMFRFDDVVAVWEFSAGEVCRALSHGFREPGLGAWPHVAGVEMQFMPLPGGKKEATVRRFVDRPNITCSDSTAMIKVAGVPFLLCGGDKYPLKAVPGDACVKEVRARQLRDPPGNIERGQKLSDITEAAIRAARPDGIKPEVGETAGQPPQ